MKRLYLLAWLFYVALCSVAFANEQDIKPISQQMSQPETAAMGSHGMALFGGREALYASHLPMFHAPHDTQVVFRFHLQDSINDALLRAALAIKPQLWTLDPAPFDLLRIKPGHADPLTQFSTNIVEGHFERGGLQRFSNQATVINEVIYFQRLSPAAKSTSAGRYRLIGQHSE